MRSMYMVTAVVWPHWAPGTTRTDQIVTALIVTSYHSNHSNVTSSIRMSTGITNTTPPSSLPIPYICMWTRIVSIEISVKVDWKIISLCEKSQEKYVFFQSCLLLIFHKYHIAIKVSICLPRVWHFILHDKNWLTDLELTFTTHHHFPWSWGRPLSSTWPRGWDDLQLYRTGSRPHLLQPPGPGWSPPLLHWWRVALKYLLWRTQVFNSKQAYMAYKSRLDIIAEVYWLKIKTFIHILFYRLF